VIEGLVSFMSPRQEIFMMWSLSKDLSAAAGTLAAEHHFRGIRLNLPGSDQVK
jgi:hypothetical protein